MFQAFGYLEFERSLMAIRESNPYRVRITGRCGPKLQVSRHDPNIEPIWELYKKEYQVQGQILGWKDVRVWSRILR